VVTVLTVVGARPQFIKAAPVSRALRRQADEYLVHTGQHYDPAMSKVFFDELDIPPPDVNLEVGSGSHGRQTGEMLAGIEEVIVEQSPDWVLVYGDTNSTAAGALAAAKLNVRVAHVEAGLRSGRRDMPEEINRIVTDHVADLLLAPTSTAMEHLTKEGLEDRSRLVGDVMVDALNHVRENLISDPAGVHGIKGSYLVATMHRAETVDHPARLTRALELFGSMPLPVVLPLHPRTAAAMERFDLAWPHTVTIVEPVGYREMMSLVAGAEAVLTDSGGLQKEATLLGTRCLTLRPETEWPETLANGWNAVVDLDIEAASNALAAPPPTSRLVAFGDGHAAERVVAALLQP